MGYWEQIILNLKSGKKIINFGVIKTVLPGNTKNILVLDSVEFHSVPTNGITIYSLNK